MLALSEVMAPMPVPPSAPEAAPMPAPRPPPIAAPRPAPNAVVKAAVSFAPGATTGNALYFSRNLIPSGPGDHYHHIGIYAFRRAALRRFVTLKPTLIELRERLEQLRAIEDGMRMAAALVDTIPLGVDTPADLERARRLLGAA